MMTRAGRFSSTTSQGSPSWSTRGERPMARATACGSGNKRGPAMWAPTYQAARSSANDTSRAATFSIPQSVERAAVEFACRSYEFGASDLGQHAIKCARVRFFVGYIAAEDTFRIALAEDRESLRIA